MFKTFSFKRFPALLLLKPMSYVAVTLLLSFIRRAHLLSYTVSSHMSALNAELCSSHIYFREAVLFVF
jgi:hypothetical protein